MSYKKRIEAKVKTNENRIIGLKTLIEISKAQIEEIHYFNCELLEMINQEATVQEIQEAIGQEIQESEEK